MALELSSGELGEHTTCNGVKERGPAQHPTGTPCPHLLPHAGMVPHTGARAASRKQAAGDSDRGTRLC